MAQSPITMSVSIEDDDDDFNRFMLELESDVDSVDIGLLADEDAEFLIIGAANEFGTRDGHIPERSFIRAGVDLNEGAIAALSDREYGAIVDGRKTKAEALSRMGEEIQRFIQKRIRDIKIPPNALSTIKAKARKKGRRQIRAAKKKGAAAVNQVIGGFDNPLIDTGRLRASVRWILARSKDGESGI